LDSTAKVGGGSAVLFGGLMMLSPLAALGGAVMGPSREETARAAAVVRPILEDAAADDVFAARFAAAADSVAGVKCVAAADAATLVQLHIDRFALDPRPGRSMVADNLAVVVTVRARVVRAADGRVLYEGAVTTGAANVTHTLVEWSAADGRELREAIDAALTPVATALAEELFLVDRTLAAPRGERP